MSNKQQSSVEWLIAELGEYFPQGIGGIELMVLKAKAMHEQEIIEAHDEGEGKIIGNGLQYYNETFGGKNDQQ